MSNENNLSERVKGIEVKIYGNGSHGIDDRVKENCDAIKVLKKEIGELKLNAVSNDKFEEHKGSEERRFEDMEDRLIERFTQELKNRERTWLKYLGPILTGVAAIVAVLI